MNRHSAAGPALGYAYQICWPLLKLIRESSSDPDLRLQLEGADDVGINRNIRPDDLVQLKHHVGSGSLTEKSVDFWRTINVWMDAEIKRKDKLFLVTTQTISPDSDLSYLQDNDSREPKVALAAIEEAAKTSSSTTTKKWRDKFSKMRDEKKALLVESITICDNSPDIENIDEILRRELSWAIPLTKGVVFLDKLKAWWLKVAIELLTGAKKHVTGHEIKIEVSRIRDSLTIEDLPLAEGLNIKETRSDPEDYRGELFLKQLDWVKSGNNVKAKATADFEKASQQLSYWLRHQLVSDQEIEDYEDKLFDKWDTLFSDLQDEHENDSTIDTEKEGRNLRRSLNKQTDTKIRNNFSEVWFYRGNFEILANRPNGPRLIGWHVDFRNMVDQYKDDSN